MVTVLERRRLPRVPAVVLVVVLALGVLGGVGMVLVTQVMSLGGELPSYKDNIKEKISDLRLLGRSSGLEPVKDTVTRAAGEVERDVEKTKPPESQAAEADARDRPAGPNGRGCCTCRRRWPRGSIR